MREAASIADACFLTVPRVPVKSVRPVDSHREWVGAFAQRAVVWSSCQPSEGEQKLLLTLAVLSAPRSGLVLIEKTGLVWLLAMESDTLDTLLGSLEQARLIQLLESGPYLVISLKAWSGKEASADREIALKTGVNASQTPPSIPPPVANASPLEKNYSNGSRATAQAGQHSAGRERGDGVMGLGSGEEGELVGFLRELGKLIDAPDQLAGLKTFCERYDPSILNAALERLRRTPRDRIRKSPAALFTYLVKTLNRERNK
jgi:hypothetical protein